ncbi:unnamed protein product [Caenorhabditis bovis]|uniref:SAM domain-containing protein n=1 Tax=Caenorhabditis bovis TaxID=2654633 RepID=A0A8S1EE28_9PELO|nr:unnamed protein product [Caenorhabditis bovis]
MQNHVEMIESMRNQATGNASKDPRQDPRTGFILLIYTANATLIDIARTACTNANCSLETIPGGFPEKRLSTWTIDETRKWMLAITGNENVARKCFEEEIDGLALNFTSLEELVEILDLRIGHKIKIRAALQALKEYDAKTAKV